MMSKADLNKINQAFDITEGVVVEMDNSIKDIVPTDGDIFEEATLKTDFNTCRSVILESIQSARILIAMLGQSIGPGSSGSVITSFSEVVRSLNESISLLCKLYVDLEKLKNKDAMKKSGAIQNQVNIISTNLNDILEKISKKS